MTAITRQASTARFPDGVQVKRYTPGDHASLVEALRGQQFLVLTLPAGGAADKHGLEVALVRAAAEAGVSYVMPNVYGPDPLNEAMMADVHLGAAAVAAKREVERLRETTGTGGLKWVMLATGFWYEWSLVGHGAVRFGCDLARRTMTFFDDGEAVITTSTWDQCGRALAALLALPWLRESGSHDENDKDKQVAVLDDWADRAVYISSFRVHQKDLFASALRVTGTTADEWTVRHENSQERWARAQARMTSSDADAATRLAAFSTQLYTRIFFPTGEGNHAARHGGLANAALGLPAEDMDAATREGLRLEALGKLSY